MNNEAEMRKIFKELNIENQAVLLVRARKSSIDHKKSRNEEGNILRGKIKTGKIFNLSINKGKLYDN